MPHGLSSDTEGNLWLTDVARHQVLKYSPNGELLFTLGEAFVPGNDAKHFCKPTDVAVSNDRSSIFVADGYCNARLVQFDAQGQFLRQFTIDEEEKDPLVIPHSILLIEPLQLLCVADRENGRSLFFQELLPSSSSRSRIVCFDLNDGEVKAVITEPAMKTVYAITLDANQREERNKERERDGEERSVSLDRLYAVSGGNAPSQALGFTFSVRPETFGELLSTWKPHQVRSPPPPLLLLDLLCLCV